MTDSLKWDFKVKKKLLQAALGRESPEILIKQIKNYYTNGVMLAIPNLVLAELNRGNTPVQDGEYKKSYSASYKKQIKKGYVGYGKAIQPVNLKVTGDLHKSFEAERIPDGVKVTFKSKIAKYHDILGAGKSKVIRRMLPKDGEQFTKRITKALRDILKEAFDKIVR